MESSNHVNPVLSFKFTPFQWLSLGAVSILLLGLAYQAYLPFKAERAYRDGYNLDALHIYPDAIENFKSAIHFAPWDTQYKLELARLYCDAAMAEPDPVQKMKYLREALAISERMIEEDQLNPWHKNRMGSIYTLMAEADPANAKNYMDLAEFNVKAAAEDDAQNPLFQLNLAFFYHRQGRLAEAQANYQKALSLDPSMPEARYNLADMYLKRNQLDQALQEYLLVTRYAPGFLSSNAMISAISTLRYNQTQESKYLGYAISALEQILTTNPSDMQALRSLAQLYFKVGNWAKCADMGRQLVTLYANQEDIYPIYVQALVKSGRSGAVLQEMKARLASNPYDTVAASHVKFLTGSGK
jgi:tetratricopeptide (TPR) repeat protein